MAIAFIRTIALYLILIVGIRLMGKRQVGELEPSELVLAMLLSDLAAVPMQDFGIPLLYGIIPIITVLCITMILSVLNVKSLKFRAIMCGTPSIIVEHGTLRQKELRRNRFTLDELMEELRQQSITDLSTVEYAILETNGKLSVLLYPEFQGATAGKLYQTEAANGYPLVLINDGHLIPENLKRRGVDEIWLKRRLKEFGVSHYKDIFLLTADQDLRLYCTAKEDRK